ncbi:helix-turn-helix domain-containing protein [Streptomyces goshikiensis]|uniref:helix-turn-helix domain-containing protein n=1 Tax=Streptomyces goshikiensis TaxID=1942 RepID=UPI0037D4FA9E
MNPAGAVHAAALAGRDTRRQGLGNHYRTVRSPGSCRHDSCGAGGESGAAGGPPVAVNANPSVRRGRLGAEPRRLHAVSGLTSRQVVERLWISQPEISHVENGRRTIRPRDVRDLCVLF